MASETKSAVDKQEAAESSDKSENSVQEGDSEGLLDKSFEEPTPKSDNQINSETESAATEDATEALEAPTLEKALAQLEELKEQYLRAVAEGDNIRKRAAAEVSSARKFALESFARELLSVKDSLELAHAVDLKGDADDKVVVEKVVEGIDLTLKQLEVIFGRFAIEEVYPEVGDKFDPENHQAVSVEETIKFDPNRVCSVIQKGYLLHNRLLRPAMVVVAKAPNDA